MGLLDQTTLPSTPLPVYTTQERQVHPHMQDAQREAINRALALLPQEDQEAMPNIELVPGSKIPGIGRTPSARTMQGNPNIYVIQASPEYQDAQKGDREAIIKEASNLMHERHHLEHGPDEASAYDKQLAILRRLGASKRTIQSVEEAKQYVTRQK